MCFLSSDTNSSPSCQFEVQFTSHLQPISAHLFFFLEIASQEADNKHVMLKKRLATKVRSARIWFGIIQFDQKCIFFFFFFFIVASLWTVGCFFRQECCLRCYERIRCRYCLRSTGGGVEHPLDQRRSIHFAGAAGSKRPKWWSRYPKWVQRWWKWAG